MPGARNCYARDSASSVIICDTGPLVAAAIATDPDHHRCVELFTGLHLANRPIVVPAPIVAEVGYLLERYGGPRAESGFLRSLSEDDFVSMELTKADYARMADLVDQYADFPLGTSDASVVALAERLDEPEVATLDLRHFSVVRPKHVRALTLLPD
ncbi:type II toxin-antitoxin system VapC family toxin [Haloechinothrix salitolerans]|uniref:Ribonuclease VapC n=1 Tax=Haloechinothrix salitolerans TaxID=926830 RepID=A0ABW2BU71_9PSEU